MTVTSVQNKIYYNGNGVTKEFDYDFKIFEDSELVVIIRNKTTGAESTQTLSVDYTVTGAGDDNGGSITFVSYTPTSNETVIIYRNVNIIQSSDYEDGSALYSDTLEGDFDRGIMIDQQQQETLDRSIRIPVTDPENTDVELPNSINRASKYLAFDADGNLQATAGTNVNVSSFINTMLDDANADAVKDTLEFSSLGKTLSQSTSGSIQSDIGISPYAQTLLDDQSPSAARVTIDVESGVNVSRKWQHTQTFDNETLSTGTTASPSATWDLSTQQIARVTLDKSLTITISNMPSASAHYTLMVTQAPSGAYTVAWSNEFKWIGGNTPTITVNANAVDIATFFCDGINMYGSIGQNYS